jgi:hypothetical protein
METSLLLTMRSIICEMLQNSGWTPFESTGLRRRQSAALYHLDKIMFSNRVKVNITLT